MKLFRCYNCKREFEAAAPACTPCGIDPVAHPRDAGIVVPLVLHHFDPPGRRPGVGLNHAACDPKIKAGTRGLAFTGEAEHVNCPKCKLTEAYKLALEGGAAASEEFLSRPVA